MRICYVGNASSIHLQRWLKWVASRGHDVHLITDFPIEINNVKMYSIEHKKRSGVKNFISKMRETKRFVKEINPDLLHAHYVFGYGTFGAYANFHPYVLTAWGSDILVDTSSMFKKVLVKYALKKADLITCDGENTMEKMIGLETDPKKIHLIYHGIDPTQFSSAKRDNKIKEKLGISNCSVVISTRNLDPIYSVETLIKSAPLVLKKLPHVKFIIVGELIHNGTTDRDYLKTMAKSLGVMDSIKFVGSMPHDEIPYYLTSSDVYVSTSLSDGGIALSTLEAMACEVAPVVTDVADNKKWIKDGKNGFIIGVKDSKTLAEKIIYLLGNEDVRIKFGKNNRKIVEAKQNYVKEMEKMEKLYKDIVN